MPADPLTILKTWSRMRAGELQVRMGVSRATMMRATRARAESIIVRGNARRTAYAARRKVRGVELPARAFLSRLPLPDESAAWTAAAIAAISFWESASADRRINAAFRTLCQENAGRLRVMT